MKRWRVTMKGKDGALVFVHVRAKDKETATSEAERSQYRREERFPLTFARLEQAKETGDAGLLAVPQGMGGKALSEAWVKAETERRKRDQDRYGLKVMKVEEAA